MQGTNRSFRKNRRGVSPAISTVVITAATVVMVLVSGSYALQLLERQRASTEFDVAVKSILTFDDAVRDIAWDRGGSRSVRFTTNYGALHLLQQNKSVNIRALEYSAVNQDLSTGVVRYSIPTSYLTFGNGYSSYILGNESTVVSSTAASVGQALASQELGYVNVALSYRVRVTEEGPSSLANYVDILMIRLNCATAPALIGDFDLVARNTAITSTPLGPFPAGNSTTTISVSVDGGSPNTVTLALNPNLQVIFNLIVADVRVST